MGVRLIATQYIGEFARYLNTGEFARRSASGDGVEGGLMDCHHTDI